MTAAQMKQLTDLLERQHRELLALIRELLGSFNQKPGSS
jgi:hypothetical protein